MSSFDSALHTGIVMDVFHISGTHAVAMDRFISLATDDEIVGATDFSDRMSILSWPCALFFIFILYSFHILYTR